MTRRELLLGAGGLVLGSTLGGDGLAWAASPKGKAPADAGANPYLAAINASRDCIQKGEICVNHCQTLLSTGDTSMANCLRTALDMEAACKSFSTLAAYQSTLVKKAAALCAEACRNCEKACREHEGHHKICKDCAEACNVCARECEKIMA